MVDSMLIHNSIQCNFENSSSCLLAIIAWFPCSHSGNPKQAVLRVNNFLLSLGILILFETSTMTRAVEISHSLRFTTGQHPNLGHRAFKLHTCSLYRCIFASVPRSIRRKCNLSTLATCHRRIRFSWTHTLILTI